ncbi:MAG: hypothetical protein CM15mP36_12960 [Flavobacteriales bacterium]|nr:MAG: hypothetical protein CM15mP36_12960 [Flavobacteriales bacterium]
MVCVNFYFAGDCYLRNLKTSGAKTANDYIKAGNEAKWWTIGLSVMATQASAITFIYPWPGL